MHDTAHPRVPSALAAVASRLPMFPLSALAAVALTLAARRSGDPETLGVLEGRALRVIVRDAGIAMTVRCRAGRFVPLPAGVAADAAIGATLGDFVALARRREDPDTLFFHRRLTLEGDTEAALALRNLLDRIDFASLLPSARG